MEQTQTKPEVVAPVESAPAPVPKPARKKRRWLKPLIVVVLILAALFFFVIRPMLGAGKQMVAGMYLTGTAHMADMTVSVDSTGTIKPIDSYNVSGLVTGDVLEAPFEEGDYVEKGDLLYRIDPGTAENALEQAQLSVRQAQLAYDTTVDGLNPKSTFSGVIQQLMIQEGSLVSAGTPIAEVSDTSVMTLTLPFLSSDAALIFEGQSAVITLSGTLETLLGTVESVASADQVGAGGSLVRQVKLRVENPGALTTQTQATAKVGNVACSAAGTFQPNRSQTVVATGSGEVTALYVSQGSRVEAGTVLATLGGSAANTALENAAIALEQANLSLSNAMDALENYTITAPISGTVIEKNFKAGDTIDSNQLSAASGTLAVLYDMSSLTFEMRVDEQDINKIQVGQSVRVTADAVEGTTFTGVVDQVNINGSTANGQTSYPITVMLEQFGALKPGMNVSADVIVEEAGTVLCVPVDAVDRGTGTPIVTVVPPEALDEKGNVADPTKLEQREVTLGRNDMDNIEILSGLSEGEVVAWTNQASNPFAAMMMG